MQHRGRCTGAHDVLRRVSIVRMVVKRGQWLQHGQSQATVTAGTFNHDSSSVGTYTGSDRRR